MIAMLIAYPIAPFGFSDTTEQGTVLDKNGLPKTFERNVSRNPFFGELREGGGSYVNASNTRTFTDFVIGKTTFAGPKQSDLVLMGAKFAPCMRKDARVFDEIINPQNDAEADDGELRRNHPVDLFFLFSHTLIPCARLLLQAAAPGKTASSAIQATPASALACSSSSPTVPATARCVASTPAPFQAAPS